MAPAQSEVSAIDCAVCGRSLSPKRGKGGKFAVFHCPSVGKKHFTAFVAVPGAAVDRKLEAEADDLLSRFTALAEREKT